MTRKTLIIALLSGLFLMSLNYRIFAFDDGDFQIWNTDVQEEQINNKAKITLEEEFRFGDNANDFYYHHYDLGFVYILNKYLNSGFGYRQIFEKKNAEFKQENEPYIIATLFWGLSGFKFDSRNRLEYRHFNYQTDLWRYRNKFTMKFPWKFTRIGIQPYLSDEIFLALNRTQLNQNRFYSGLLFNLTSNINLDIHYLLQSTKGSDRWIDANVLGTKLKISF